MLSRPKLTDIDPSIMTAGYSAVGGPLKKENQENVWGLYREHDIQA